ncbi:MAG: amidase [Acidobacteriota bacterium]
MSIDRRRFLSLATGAGFSALLTGNLSAQEKEALTKQAIEAAEALAGMSFTPSERELMASGVRSQTDGYAKIRELALDNSVAPAFSFQPLPTGRCPREPADGRVAPTKLRGKNLNPTPEELPFLSLVELGALLRAKRISSVELTQLYLDRIERFDPRLSAVITALPERALKQAREADAELARGRDRGPLHGIPWGVKDLFAVPGYPTTWGAAPFENQYLDTTAEVVRRLDDAGAVLIAKTSVGALAWGDVWFGGTTKNPWLLDQGSSGSSAGSASTVVAGLVGFAIGTETLGSIISPAQRCGATGLRPTSGRVGRSGGMALSWTMDKVGPLCRHVEDCALVLAAVAGHDPGDPGSLDAPFGWDADAPTRSLRVGVDRESLEQASDDERAALDDALHGFQQLGFTLKDVTLPSLPIGEMLVILTVEAAAAFDELTTSGRDDLLVRQVEQAWPNVFRTARMVPAVEYVQAQRARRVLMEQYEQALADVDVYVHSTYGGRTLTAANLTGHPTLCMPNGFRENGTPRSVSLTSRLLGEHDLLRVGKDWQDATGHHRKHPPLV